MLRRILHLLLLLALGLTTVAATAPQAFAEDNGEEKLKKAIAEEEKDKAADKAEEAQRKEAAKEEAAKRKAEEEKRAAAAQQKLEAQCAFKPVMSDDDIAKCRAAYPVKP